MKTKSNNQGSGRERVSFGEAFDTVMNEKNAALRIHDGTTVLAVEANERDAEKKKSELKNATGAGVKIGN